MEILWQAVGSVAAILTMFGFLPQVLKMFKTHSVKDMSVLTILQTDIGVFLWIIYGIYKRDTILIIANFVSFIIVSTVLGLYIRYRGQSGV
jgi:MtN3 and saliva related transmembrane protein